MISDIKVIKSHFGTELIDVDDRTTSSQTTNLQPGEPVKRSGNFAIALATGDPENGTDLFLGIVKQRESSETSTVDGDVVVEICGPGSVLSGRATTPANMDTAAKLLGIKMDYIAMDVTGAGTNGPTGVFTFDEDEGDDPNVHGFMVLGGDIEKGVLRVMTAISMFYGNGI